jgi:hypothetical protein
LGWIANGGSGITFSMGLFFRLRFAKLSIAKRAQKGHESV